MRNYILMTSVLLVFSQPSVSLATDSDIEALKQQLNSLKKDYQQQIQALEKRLAKAESNVERTENQVNQIAVANKPVEQQNKFNPAISLILNGRYASFDNDPDSYALPGYALGEEAGLGSKGFALEETELTMSSNIDNNFFGQVTFAFDGEGGNEIEEAFIQTLGLGHGFTIKAGRFFSKIGYLNQQHVHTWDFSDAPLIYRGLFGDQLIDDGVQVNYIAPTDTFLQLGAEVLSGDAFPAGGTKNGIGAWTAFVNTGGDIGIEHSWLLGLSHWRADKINDRASQEIGQNGTPYFSGESQINSLSFIYKWAPNGNPGQRNFKAQFEYFDRHEDGEISFADNSPVTTSRYDGHQSGWYAEGVYQFTHSWRAALRYDRLNSTNRGSNNSVLVNAGLDDAGHTPERFSLALDWLPSEFSRIRLQYNRDESYQDSDNQLFLQYTTSFGSHGAHQY